MPARLFFGLKIASFLILLGGFLFITSHSIDPDLGWHLAAGKWISWHHAVPRTDIYSHTMQGFSWVDHEWLSDLCLWWLQVHGLWWIVVLLFTFFAAAPFAVWLYRSRSFLDLWFILLAAMFMPRIIGVRPQVISFFLFFIFYEIFSQRYYLNAESQKIFKQDIFPNARISWWFLLLPIFFLLWANLHVGFVLALGFLGFMGAFYIIWQWWVTSHIPWRMVITDASIFFLSALATLANPYGWRVYEFFYHALRSPETSKYIIEWQSVLAFPLFSTCVFIAMVLLFLFQLRREYPRHVFAVGSLMLVGYLRSVRNGPLFFIVAIPALTQGVQLLSQKISAVRQQAHMPFTPSELKKMQQIGLALVVTGLFGFVYVLNQFQNPGYPVIAAQNLREYIRQGNEVTLFNEYGWGGYLIWQVPEVRVFIDGRMDAWVDQNGNSAMREYIAATDTTMPDAWKEVFRRRQITAVLVPNTAPPPMESLGWVDRMRWSFRQNHWIGGLYNILVNEQPGRDFGQVLAQNGWHTLYQDSAAIFMECHNGPSCYGEKQ